MIRLVDQIDYKPGYEALDLSRCANGVCVWSKFAVTYIRSA